MDPRIYACGCVGDKDSVPGVARHAYQPDLQQDPLCVPRCQHTCPDQCCFFGGCNNHLPLPVPVCGLFVDSNRRGGKWLCQKLSLATRMCKACIDSNTNKDDFINVCVRVAVNRFGRGVINDKYHKCGGFGYCDLCVWDFIPACRICY